MRIEEPKQTIAEKEIWVHFFIFYILHSQSPKPSLVTIMSTDVLGFSRSSLLSELSLPSRSTSPDPLFVDLAIALIQIEIKLYTTADFPPNTRKKVLVILAEISCIY